MTYESDRPFTIYFVRHGITEPNFRGFRCGGDLDLPMMDIGCDQAYLLAKQIEKMHLRIGVIIAGSLIRTRQTAASTERLPSGTAMTHGLPSGVIAGSTGASAQLRRS